MKLNKSKDTVTTLGHERVFYDTQRYDESCEYHATHGLEQPEPMHIGEFLGQLVWPLVEANPEWEFHCDYGHHTNEVKWVTIFCRGEELGDISQTTRGSKRVWVIRNDRIFNKLERGNGRQTSDFNKAMKIIKKEFGTKTLAEMAHESHDLVGRTVRSATHVGSNQFRRSYENVFYHIVDYVMGEGFDKICEVALQSGIHKEWPAEVQDLWEADNIRRKIHDDMSNGDGYVVVLHGGYYAVSPSVDHGHEKAEYYDEDTVPANIKRGVGMLKLAEEDAFVKDVGVRCSENTFFIVKELGV